MKEEIKKFLKNGVLRYFLLSIIIYFITECFSRRSPLKGIVYLFTHPVIFLLNTLIVFWTYSIVMLTKRKKFTTVLISSLWIAIGVVDFILRSYRVTPFNASDFRQIKSAISVATVYMSWWQLGLIALSIIAFIGLIIFLFIKLPKGERKGKWYISAVIVVVTFFAVHGVADLAVDMNLLPSKFGNLTEAYKNYGMAYCFSNSLLNVGISKPDNYSEEVVSGIVNDEIAPQESLSSDLIKHDNQDENSDREIVYADRKTPNIIFLQLESFFDVSRINDVTFSEDPIPNFHKLKSENISGFLSVPSVGAGTANTEFETITGMNLDFFGAGEYPYNTVLKSTVCESFPYDLKSIGYTASAIHNNDGSFYGRDQVFSQLGFDKFVPLEYMNNYDTTPLGWAKDYILTNEIMQTLRLSEGADYIYTISVQGHGAYPTEDILGDKKVITVSGLEDEEEKNALEYYVNQIHDMDLFIKCLTDTLSSFDEDTVLIMYGDHLPSLNLTEDRLTNHDTFQTEYIIWSNFDLQGENKDVEAYQLGSYVLNLLDIHVGTMICYHQNYLNAENSLNEEEKESYLNGMEILEYDILYGDHSVYNGSEPYKPTDLKFGNYDINIERIWSKDNFMYVLGGEFNEYSKIFIDGKPIDTKFISSNVIYAPEVKVNYDSTHEVEVYQVGDDKTLLGGSNKVIYDGEKIVTGAQDDKKNK